MLDRLALGLVSIPANTYDTVLILSDADGSRNESQRILNKEIYRLLVKALKESGKLQSQDGKFGGDHSAEHAEAILAGLRYEKEVGYVKPDQGFRTSVPLALGNRKETVQDLYKSNGDQNQATIIPASAKRKSQDISGNAIAGVGFVNSSEGTENSDGGDSDDEIIDEDTLLTEEDLKRPVKIRESLQLVALKTANARM